MRVRAILGVKPMSDFQHSSDQSGAGRQAICNLYKVLESRIPDEDLAIDDPSSLPSIATALEQLDVGLKGYDLRDFRAGIEAMQHFEPTFA